MAWITGRVQTEEFNEPRDINVGEPFAYMREDGNYYSLDGKILRHIKISTEEIIKRIEKLKKVKNN